MIRSGIVKDDKTITDGIDDATLMSEPALAEDWNKPEEDEAWEHLMSTLESIKKRRTQSD